MRKKLVVLGLVVALVVMAVPVVASAQSMDASGSIHAEGSGTAAAHGNGVVEFSGRGTLYIRDWAGDAVIEINSGTPQPEAQAQAQDRGVMVFRGFDGTARIEGSRITVALRGRDIVMDAEGQGWVRLYGRGTYETGGGQTGEWFHFRRWQPFGENPEALPQEVQQGSLNSVFGAG